MNLNYRRTNAEDIKLTSRWKLKMLLSKLGLKSPISLKGTITEQDLRDMMNMVKNNSGAPDKLIVDPASLRVLRNLVK